ncbi:MAG TPA: hypothetical protein DC046_11725 [Rhodospirillaceae bacterium]|nr:hypothetical protein [Rhodospirillaceae bacterium]
MRHTNRIFTTALAFVLGIVFLAGAAQADSKKWRANNHTDYSVNVYWIATGCAGMEYPCDDGDLMQLVCKKKKLSKGEETSYEFEDSTSDRKKKACNTDLNGSLTGTDDRKANEIYQGSDFNAVKWVNE